MTHPKPIGVKELYSAATWGVPAVTLLMCIVLLPTYFETPPSVRKGAVTLSGSLLLFLLPAVARHLKKGAVRRLAVQSLHAVVVITLWLFYGEMWEGAPTVGAVTWWFADAIHVFVGVLVAYTRNSSFLFTLLATIGTALLLVLVPVSRSTSEGPSPAFHSMVFLLLWYIEMTLAGTLYSGIEFTYLVLVCLPALRTHIFVSMLYVCVLGAARGFEFYQRRTLQEFSQEEEGKNEEKTLLVEEEKKEEVAQVAVSLSPIKEEEEPEEEVEEGGVQQALASLRRKRKKKKLLKTALPITPLPPPKTGGITELPIKMTL